VIACPPITTWVPPAAYTYQVRVESGSASCADARRILRRYVVTATSPAAWTCFRGHSGDSWAAACAKGNAIVRAYGPRREHDRWRIAAARLTMPVVAPANPPGLALVSVKPQKLTSCGAIKEEVTALYRGGGRELYVIEGRPRVCGDIGDATVVKKTAVHGRAATVWRLGARQYLLVWSERGAEIGFQTAGFTIAQLLGFARGSAQVLA